MINEYLYEIIALIVIIVVALIYVLIKKKQKSDENIYETKIDDSIIEDDFDINTQEDIIVDDFDEEIQNVVEVKETIKKSTATKRTVPIHGKITKEDFKEFSGKRILVAEDNIINQKVIKGLLADTGIEIIIANDGQEALDVLNQDSNFLIILMDAHMPTMDGFEATRNIRANKEYDHIVVVALSGDVAPDDIRKMSEAGMQEHLEKPLQVGALYDILYAYSGEQKNVEKKVEVQTKNIKKELDIKKGLDICGDDRNFYIEILDEFTNSYSDSTNKLMMFIKSNNIFEADKLLLDLTGILANIGAENLQTIAKKLKSAIKDTTNTDYISLLKEYKKSHQQLLLDIKEYRDAN